MYKLDFKGDSRQVFSIYHTHLVLAVLSELDIPGLGGIENAVYVELISGIEGKALYPSGRLICKIPVLENEM